MKRIFLFTIATIFTLFAKAEKIDINVKSTSMNKMVSGYVITPDSYKTDTDKLFPCVYLLHGFGGSKNSWLYVKKDLQQISTKYNFVFVLPDVGNSWYIDSPLNKNSKYETFVAKELVEYIDKNYRTIATKEGRAITGYSMGGHGALLLCLKHQDTFGAAGSMSGVADLRMNVNQAKIDVLGEYSQNRSAWDENSVIYNLNRVHRKRIPAIIFDCGTEDRLLRANEKLHQEMLDMLLPHEYIVRPGGHNHPYWCDAIDTHIMFFLKRFPKQ